MEEPYIALSHCWGEPHARPLQTTSGNLSVHLERIGFEKLPKSFQDATVVASNLGVTRLWIDSLCIIQDDVADWQRECPLMAEIYSGAVVTIAASDAHNSHTGFLKEYSPDLRCTIGTSIQIRCIPTFESAGLVENEESILSGRGWALQEAIFSPRLISFKKARMQWHCSVEARSDDLQLPYESRLNTYGGSIADRPTVAKLSSWDRAQVYSSWRDVVESFSRMKLTMSTDKLPALSGLAKFICEKLDDKYAAGIFLKDACNCMCWAAYRGDLTCSVTFARYDDVNYSLTEDFGSSSVETQPVDYRAPSWSWASTDGALAFRPMNDPDLEIIDCQTELRGHDEFGEVVAGFIHGRGRLFKLAVRRDHALLLRFKATFYRRLGDGAICFDNAQAAYDTYSGEVGPITLLLLGYNEEVKEVTKLAPPGASKGKENMWEWHWYALVLKSMPEKGQDCYRRIGLAMGDYNDYTWSVNCARENVTLF
jgi:hypothetical protein